MPAELDTVTPRLSSLPVGRGRVLLTAVTLLLAVVARFSTLNGRPAVSSNPERHQPDTLDHASAVSGTDHAAVRRVKQLGQHLLRHLPSAAVSGIRFQVKDGTSEARSWSGPRHGIVVTRPMVDALPENAWLATILSYEIGIWLQSQLPGAAADVDSFVISLMRVAGFDTQVVADMSEWVLTSTSARPAEVNPDVIAAFHRRLADLVARDGAEGSDPVFGFRKPLF